MFFRAGLWLRYDFLSLISMKYLLALLLTSLLVACGSSISPDIDIPATTDLRSDLLYGYYGSDCAQVAEVVGHTNLYWDSGWFGGSCTISNILAAKQTTVLDVSQQVYQDVGDNKFVAHPNGENLLRDYFIVLRDAGALKYVSVLYPRDEPNITVVDGSIAKINAMVRNVASEFPDLRGVKLAVIYAGGHGFDGLEDYDWVGFDDYDARSSIFVSGEYQTLRALMKPWQKVILVPGGAFGQDITPFLNFAETHSEVAAIVPFIYFNNWGGQTRPGISGLPLRKQYCEAGLQISGKSGTCL